MLQKCTYQPATGRSPADGVITALEALALLLAVLFPLHPPLACVNQSKALVDMTGGD